MCYVLDELATDQPETVVIIEDDSPVAKRRRSAADAGGGDDSSSDDPIGSTIQCVICFETIHSATSVFPCLHTFCGGCLSTWFNDNSTCPTVGILLYLVSI